MKNDPRARGVAGMTAVPNLERVITPDEASFVFRIDDYPMERAVWNSHPEYEIHLIRKGTGTAFVGDYVGEFRPGNLVIVGSWLPHDWVSYHARNETIPGRDLVIQFDRQRLQETAAHFPELSEIVPFLDRALRGIEIRGEAAQEAAKLAESIGELNGLKRLARFFELLSFMAHAKKSRVLSSDTFNPEVDVTGIRTTQNAIAFIRENVSEPISLNDVAKFVGLGANKLSRQFKRCTGITYSDYILQIRIGKACQLLEENDAPIADICYSVGYGNLSNFNRSFRNIKGTTPSKFRRDRRDRSSITTPFTQGTSP
ncbi:AraC family transcriptional regulator [Devosia sp. CN2-171]|uniref:AraC family transcriptional regulator n=1 Tax=Devosia sp. CN2-171 TaxID=3400909 RepID=UPI003BF909C6